MRFNNSAKRKYNKINQQRKFHLLTLIYKRHMPLREAAEIAGVNFLTAKTIVFFHKNNCPTYQFDLTSKGNPLQQEFPVAGYANVRKCTTATTEKLIKPLSKIEVICSIGNVLIPQRRGDMRNERLRQCNKGGHLKSEQGVDFTSNYDESGHQEGQTGYQQKREQSKAYAKLRPFLIL